MALVKLLTRGLSPLDITQADAAASFAAGYGDKGGHPRPRADFTASRYAAIIDLGLFRALVYHSREQVGVSSNWAFH